MSRALFDLPPPVLIPVAGEAAGYPGGRIFCVGRNYAAHAAEMGAEVDRGTPVYFTKSPSAAVLSGARLPYPPGTTDLHHEVELVLALGSEVFRAGPEAAGAAIYAYGTGLDMTRRDLQAAAKERRHPWDLGKDFEGSAVFGPLTRAAAAEPVGGQRIHLEVGGETRQSGRLSEMIWSPAEIVADLSRYYHLRPGDLIMTGTPAGVGAVGPGDRIEGGVEGLAPVVLEIGPPE